MSLILRRNRMNLKWKKTEERKEISPVGWARETGRGPEKGS